MLQRAAETLPKQINTTDRSYPARLIESNQIWFATVLVIEFWFLLNWDVIDFITVYCLVAPI